MARRPISWEEARRIAWSMPCYDRRGRPLVFREEWEQLGRWRRLRDVLLGSAPSKRRSRRNLFPTEPRKP